MNHAARAPIVVPRPRDLDTAEPTRRGDESPDDLLVRRARTIERELGGLIRADRLESILSTAHAELAERRVSDPARALRLRVGALILEELGDRLGALAKDELAGREKTVVRAASEPRTSRPPRGEDTTVSHRH